METPSLSQILSEGNATVTLVYVLCRTSAILGWNTLEGWRGLITTLSKDGVASKISLLGNQQLFEG